MRSALPASNNFPLFIQYDAGRSSPFLDNETYLPLAGISTGHLTYSVGNCGAASLVYTGIPITNFSPPSGLLPPGSPTVTFVFNTIQATTCRYSVGTAVGYASMVPLDTGPPTTAHRAVASGLSMDPRVWNTVYIRCASNIDYLQSATYRLVAAPTGSFPRIGNIWLGGYVYANAPDIAKKTQLFLGANMSAADARALRQANPGGAFNFPDNLLPLGVNLAYRLTGESVPEPSTVLLLLAGAVAMVVLKKLEFIRLRRAGRRPSAKYMESSFDRSVAPEA